PEGIDYTVRVGRQWAVLGPGGFEHDIVASAEAPFLCERSCSPLVAGKNGRAFEISCYSEEGACLAPETRVVAIGTPDPGALADGVPLSDCVLSQHPDGGVQP